MRNALVHHARFGIGQIVFVNQDGIVVRFARGTFTVEPSALNRVVAG
jgi:hypothetical protein